ncbi:MAG: CAP domain-containing protein, partial [Okeania sp. SIO4D6]|nr:CAP domain-containing protein [Okeania sp. SIO4D6]
NMALQDFFDHTGLDGSSAGDRIETTGYDFSAWAENIAVGYLTPEAVVEGWMNSPGHRANILDPNLQEIGVGYYFLENDTGSVNFNNYWTQVFGTPL